MKMRNKRYRLLAFFLLAGTALWIGVRGQSVSENNIFCLIPKQESQFFAESDLAVLEKDQVFFSYACKIYPEVSNGVCSIDIPVVVTNENYRYFSDMEMRAGGFLNGRQSDRKLHVAVLNAAAAYQLFGNHHCIGERVYLDQIPFQVIGIAENLDRQKAEMYISNTSLPEGSEQTAIKLRELWCQFGNEADAALAISRMGYTVKEVDAKRKGLF